MSLTKVAPDTAAIAGNVAAPPRGDAPAQRLLASVIGAGLRAGYAGVAGLLLTCSLGVVVWAVTPSSGQGPVALLRAGVAAFGAGNGITVMIGRTALTLPPLMITLVAIALLTTVTPRGRSPVGDRTPELAAAAVAAAVYAAVVVCSGVMFGPVGSIAA